MGAGSVDKKSEELLFCIFRKTSEYHHLKLQSKPHNTSISDTGKITNWVTIQFESLSSSGGLVCPQTGLSTVLRG